MSSTFNIRQFIFAICLFGVFSCSEDEMFSAPEPCILTEEEQLVVNELNEEAVPFESSDPLIEETRLDRLIEYLGNAKIVGLGEGTHGTSEFFQMKDKIFRSLALEKNFNAIIFEIPWGHAMKINDFVVKGIGDADSALNQSYYWVYDTQEVRDLAQWIHDINLERTDGNKIFFVGCDPQGGDFEIEKEIVYKYLEKVQPDSALTIAAYYASLSTNLQEYDSVSDMQKETNKERVDYVYQYLLSHEEEFAGASSDYEFQIALMAAHVIKHREYIYRIQSFGTPRDSLMAVYSNWWQRIVAYEAKVAVWAHNAHVMDSRSLGGPDWMGGYLKQEHQDNYLNVGFSFGRGCLNAFVSGPNNSFAGGVRKHIVPYTSCLTVNNTLTELDGDQHYIVFNDLNHAGAAAEYFRNQQRVYQCGAGFNYKLISRYTQFMPLSKLFDVLIHFDYTNESVLM
ncbi:MAG: erythromycin esterase family protein [Bacteroidia bacterium]|nr:erythromycin esterase family protein [Bacteroidia bacterium]